MTTEGYKKMLLLYNMGRVLRSEEECGNLTTWLSSE